MDLLVALEHQGSRLDHFLTAQFPEHSRSYLQSLIAAGFIRRNKRLVRKQERVKDGDLIEITWPDNTVRLIPDDTISLSILYEDHDILVVNKQAGLVVHPGAGNRDGTLVNALLAYDFRCFSAMMDHEHRPGIVHRLDKETSGAMVVARNARAKAELITAFKRCNVRKTYLAAVHGTPHEPRGTIRSFIGRSIRNRQRMAVLDSGGKMATTHYEVLSSQSDFSLLKINIDTGRTHQIRVHLEHIGNPVIGDSTYHRKKRRNEYDAPRQMLHAWILEFPHPTTDQDTHFIAPVPHDFHDLVKRFGINLDFLTK